MLLQIRFVVFPRIESGLLFEEHDEFGWCQCGRNIHQQMQMILVRFHLVNCHIVLVANIITPLLDIVAQVINKQSFSVRI